MLRVIQFCVCTPVSTAPRPSNPSGLAHGASAPGGTNAARPAAPNGAAEPFGAAVACAAVSDGLLAPAPAARVEPDPDPDPETGGQFVLGQNYPNPHGGETIVPFALRHDGDVRLALFDSASRKVTSIVRGQMSAGTHAIYLNLNGLGLQPGDYTYQLQVANGHGVYCQSRRMTTG